MKLENNTDYLGTAPLRGLIIKLSIPAILSMVTAAIYNLVDRIFVGRFDALGLTAIGITMPFQILQMAFVLMIGIGSSTLISIECGRGKQEKAQKLLNIATSFFLMMEGMVTLFGLLFMKEIFHLLGVSKEVYPYARDYTVIILLGGIPGLLGYCLNNCVRALGKAKESMTYVVVSSLLNILLDFWFVWLLGWGVRGAAIATVLSQTLVTVFVLRYFFKHPIQETGSIRNTYRVSRKEWISGFKEIALNGIPNFCMQMVGTVVSVFLNRSILRYGGDYHLASVTILTTLSQFFLMVIYGIGQGVQPIFGFNYGAGKMERVKRCLKISLKMGTGFMLLVLLILEWIPKPLIGLFSKDENLISLTAHNGRIFLAMLPMVAIHSIGSIFFQSIKKPGIATVLYILRYGGILLPSLLIFPRWLGADGVYLSQSVSDGVSGCCALISLWMVRKEFLQWEKKDESI